MPEIKYEITQSIACLSEEKNGWTKELNLVSWNGNSPSMISAPGLRIIQKWEKA